MHVSFQFALKYVAMGRNKIWNCHLQCHLMSGDLEDLDQYTPTIDDHLSKGKISISGVSTSNRKRKV